MNFFSDNPELLEILGEARQRRKEERRRQDFFLQIPHALTAPKFPFSPHKKLIFTRLIREQQRQVSKVLLDGLYDPDSPLFTLLGARHVIMNKVWQLLKEDWKVFSEQ